MWSATWDIETLVLTTWKIGFCGPEKGSFVLKLQREQACQVLCLFYLNASISRSNLPHLWLLHQTASQLLWGWWPKCPHLQGLTTPDHKRLLCEGFPGSSQWFEFDLMSLCLGRDLRGHTGSVHPAAEKTPQDRGASTSDKSIFWKWATLDQWFPPIWNIYKYTTASVFLSFRL